MLVFEAVDDEFDELLLLVDELCEDELSEAEDEDGDCCEAAELLSAAEELSADEELSVFDELSLTEDVSVEDELLSD